jgi:serine/threonine protein kinase
MLGWYNWKDDICIVMNYFPHGDLQTYIQDRPPLAEPDAQTIISQVSRGLSIMHNGDIVHRDIKPQVSRGSAIDSRTISVCLMQTR